VQQEIANRGGCAPWGRFEPLARGRGWSMISTGRERLHRVDCGLAHRTKTSWMRAQISGDFLTPPPPATHHRSHGREGVSVTWPIPADDRVAVQFDRLACGIATRRPIPQPYAPPAAPNVGNTVGRISPSLISPTISGGGWVAVEPDFACRGGPRPASRKNEPSGRPVRWRACRARLGLALYDRVCGRASRWLLTPRLGGTWAAWGGYGRDGRLS
jgi:hypothetical protein